jgi:hypothetical protein
MNDLLTRLAMEPADVVRLRRGEVVQRAPGNHPGASPPSFVVLPVPPAPAWDVLAQWERIGELVPSLRFRVAWESLDDAGMRHALVVSELSLALMTMRYTCRATFDARVWRQSWSLVPAEELERLTTDLPSLPRNSWMLREANGSMELYPWEAGCLLVYRNQIVPCKGVPRTLEAILTKQLVREFLSSARRYFHEQIALGAYSAAPPSVGPLGAEAAPP